MIWCEVTIHDTCNNAAITSVVIVILTGESISQTYMNYEATHLEVPLFIHMHLKCVLCVCVCVCVCVVLHRLHYVVCYDIYTTISYLVCHAS